MISRYNAGNGKSAFSGEFINKKFQEAESGLFLNEYLHPQYV